MKVRTAIAIVVPLLAVTAALVLGVVIGAGRFGTGFSLIPSWVRDPVRTRRTVVSAGLLAEVRDMYTFNTVEYVYRAVFPFDFLHADTSIELILSRLRGASGRIEDVLTPREYEHWRAWNLARTHRFSVSTDRPDFVVITITVRGGFDLAGTVWDRGIAAGPDEVATVIRTIGEPRDRAVAVQLPRATVTDVIIEDVDTARYRFPDFALQPAAWREIAGFVADAVRERTIAEGLLLVAEANGREFVGGMLQTAGFDRVQFIE
ncbi:MAG: hypothetical protein EA403_07250 [Spirochaetaceae bacterium]|nr:MAG: hypothetical protein EA403_07250 [Spirochaetaceae bacterium]